MPSPNVGRNISRYKYFDGNLINNKTENYMRYKDRWTQGHILIYPYL